MLEIRVDDSGRGIAEEIRDRMFEPFVSTKRTVGVGMGLTIARHSLRSVGGEVTMSLRPEGAGAPLAPILNPALVFSAVRGDTALRVAEVAKRPATSNRESRA